MATIADVAKACGLSKATVSLVINNSALKVSPKTRARVMNVVREMNFQPSAHARSLSKQRSNMIGIVTKRRPNLLADTYYGELIDAILECASDADQTVAVYNGRIWRDSDHTQIVFGDGRCDGILLLQADHDPELTGALQSARIPFVTVNSGVTVEGVNSIDIDNVDAGYQMTQFLIEHGHRRIVCLRTPDAFSLDRLAGYRKAIEEAGIVFDPNLTMIGHYDWSHSQLSGFDRAKEIAANPALGITAVFATTDALACDAIRGFMDAGVRVPADMSVAGINDTLDAARCMPPLTTLRQSVADIGREAVRLLLDRIAHPEQEAVQCVWPAHIVVRESVISISDTATVHATRREEETVGRR